MLNTKILDTSIPDTRGGEAADTRCEAAQCERDSSGTTVATDQREGAKVMERIARREAGEACRSGSPNVNVLMS